MASSCFDLAGENSLMGNVAMSSETSPMTSNFFALPAELRNQIYELTAAESRLRLEPIRRDGIHPRFITNPPGLFIASKQVRTECKTIFLSQSRVVVTIEDLDFFELEVHIDTISKSDHEALAINSRLSLQIFIHRPWSPRTSFDLLQRDLDDWLSHRAAGATLAAQLPWRYETAEDHANTVDGRVLATRRLLQRLAKAVDPCVKAQIADIIMPFEDRLAELRLEDQSRGRWKDSTWK